MPKYAGDPGSTVESPLRLSQKTAMTAMSSITEKLIRICESLPEAQRNEVADFARFLAARQDDERWESLLA